MSSTSQSRVAVFVLLCSILSGGCADRPTDPAPVYQIGVHSGDWQVGEAGERLTNPLMVRVLDENGRSAKGVRIAWSAEETGGYVSTATSPSITDGSGRAWVHRTLGRNAGMHGTTASVDGAVSQSVRFTSIAQIDGALRIIADPTAVGHQSDTVLSTLAPFRVLILDHEDEPVPGVSVRWQAPHHGSVPITETMTDANGLAESTATLGETAGPQSVEAWAVGLLGSPVRFEVTAEPGNPTQVVVVAGSGQTAVIDQPADPYSVLIADAYGNYISGVPVDWAVTEGGGSVSPVEGITEISDPQVGPTASAVHTLGPLEGIHEVTVTARVPGEPRATFETRAVSGIVHWPISPGSTGFSPDEIEVAVGATVAWNWGEYCLEWVFGGVCSAHDLTFEDDPTEPVSSAPRSHGWHYRTFEQAGVFRFRCSLHTAGFSGDEAGVVRVH